jgi:hypothetical protein
MANINYEQANRYTVGALPSDRPVKKRANEKVGAAWSETEIKQLDRMLFVEEESTCCTRVMFSTLGMMNARPLKLHFRIEDGRDIYLVDRPFQCGGCVGCPLTMDMYRNYAPVADGPEQIGDQNSMLIGRVREDFNNYFQSCFRYCCLCTYRHEVQKPIPDGTGNPKFTTAYVVEANTCCCGRSNNLCGATCVKDDMVFVILNAKGEEVGHVQKTFAGKGDCCTAYCRAIYHYDNYVLEFPADCTSADDRMLILTTIFQLDYQLFEAKSNSNNN